VHDKSVQALVEFDTDPPTRYLPGPNRRSGVYLITFPDEIRVAWVFARDIDRAIHLGPEPITISYEYEEADPQDIADFLIRYGLPLTAEIVAYLKRPIDSSPETRPRDVGRVGTSQLSDAQSSESPAAMPLPTDPAPTGTPAVVETVRPLPPGDAEDHDADTSHEQSKRLTPGARVIAAAYDLRKSGQSVSLNAACKLARVDRASLRKRHPEAVAAIERIATADRTPRRGTRDLRTGDIDGVDDPED
jgi:hypothetical protein